MARDIDQTIFRNNVRELKATGPITSPIDATTTPARSDSAAARC